MADSQRSTARSTRLVRSVPAAIRSLLRVPLFYKILLANSAIVVAGAVAGTMTTAAFVRAEPDRSTLELVGLLALAGVVVSVMVNWLILRLALGPLDELERTAHAVQAGQFDARARLSPVMDRELERLTRVFNAMLDGLERTRRRLRDVAARALRAEEEERKRIARELHDETAQSLAAQLVRLRLLRGSTDTTARDAALDEVRAEMTRTLEGIRRYARGLRPPALDELGLGPAIEAHARSLAEATGLEVTVDTERVEGVLSSDAELAMYRIVQEAVSNALRHAQANEVRVRLAREDGTVVATVEDDGRGFAVDEVMSSQRGLGLFGMQERSAYVGGRVEIESAPGEGTRVRVEVPLPKEERNA